MASNTHFSNFFQNYNHKDYNDYRSLEIERDSLKLKCYALESKYDALINESQICKDSLKLCRYNINLTKETSLLQTVQSNDPDSLNTSKTESDSLKN